MNNALIAPGEARYCLVILIADFNGNNNHSEISNHNGLVRVCRQFTGAQLPQQSSSAASQP